MMKNCWVEGVHVNKNHGLTLGPELLMADQVGKKASLGWIEEKVIWEETLKETETRHLMFNFTLKLGLGFLNISMDEDPTGFGHLLV